MTRPSTTSVPFHTSPMPPVAMRSSNRYRLPRRFPADSTAGPYLIGWLGHARANVAQLYRRPDASGGPAVAPYDRRRVGDELGKAATWACSYEYTGAWSILRASNAARPAGRISPRSVSSAIFATFDRAPHAAPAARREPHPVAPLVDPPGDAVDPGRRAAKGSARRP